MKAIYVYIFVLIYIRFIPVLVAFPYLNSFCDEALLCMIVFLIFLDVTKCSCTEFCFGYILLPILYLF
jgi:hypothetical protein